MVRDRTGERTSREVIDRLMTNGRRPEEKAAHRRRVLASHFLTYADKYFGCEMNVDARRCYWRAIGSHAWPRTASWRRAAARRDAGRPARLRLGQGEGRHGRLSSSP